REMGVPLVTSSDLFVLNDKVYVKTVRGKQQVDVIYRRVDDAFLDPLCFRPDSTLGVPGLMSAYLQHHVVIANAPGTGVADDKSIYPYVDK
ncbi:circularly permuted type 2 ATP-grasp protein, partial [Klebsiella pneumoniae]